MTGPLAGLRIVDDTDDSGRFATKLLAGMGADVIRVSAAGSMGRPMAGEAASFGGVLDWWYDADKRRSRLDLSTEGGRESYLRLVERVDVLVETRAPGELAELGLGHERLLEANPSLVQVSITPFGLDGPRAHWKSSDLVSSALGGVMAVTGLPDRPLNIWGWQAYNYAGFLGAISALAGVRAAGLDGRGRHVDLSIHEVLTGSIENIFMQWFFDDLLPIPKLAERQGALHWLRAYDLAQCRTGYTMITPTPSAELLSDWMLETGFDDALAWKGIEPAEVLARIDEIMDGIRRWVADEDAMDIWWTAQDRQVAFGGVHDIPAVAEIPQFEHRGFFRELDAPRGVTAPGRLVRFSGGDHESEAPADADTALDDLLTEWDARGQRSPSDAPLERPLDGLRVADFTWVLAGPFAARMLGDLGADIVKIQTEERATIVNSPDFPYYFVWNRSKRSATLDIKHPDALGVVRRLIENCDVLIENYSAGVLESWGHDWDTVHSRNPGLIYVTKSGCGHDGPWKHVISYAPTVHAVCGITHLTNFADRGDVGPGFSLNDHLAGFGAATSLLAALHERGRTGLGQKIDMAQLEVGTYCIGPALLDQMSNGFAAGPQGNRDGMADHVPNEVYRCRDGFVAITACGDAQWTRLVDTVADPALADPAFATVEGRRLARDRIDQAVGEWSGGRTAADAMETLQASGVPAGVAQHAGDLAEDDPQLSERGFWIDVDHDVFGPRRTDTFPAMWDGERLIPRLFSPAYLGEHNFEVWTELAGLDFDEVAEGIGDGLFS